MCWDQKSAHKKTDICHQNKDAFTPILPKWLIKIHMYLLPQNNASNQLADRVNWVIESNK